MEQLLRSEPPEVIGGNPAALWKNPASWLHEKKLSSGFWVFFTAALFFDFGFSIYVFIFNLFLLDYHFNERAMGLVGGALTLGSVVGTLPAGQLARRIGLRPLLVVCFIGAPLLCALRAVAMWEMAQIILAFLAGLTLCLWGVCFLPAVARLTTEENRASAFSLIFSASIGTTTLGGVVCGYLPRWLSLAGFTMQPAEVKRLILLTSCVIAATGLFAVLQLRLPLPKVETSGEDRGQDHTGRRRWRIDPFLLRYLPSMALWTAVLTSFTPFANVYLASNLHIPLLRIGLIFSAAQIVQFCTGLLTPMIFHRLGLTGGIVAMQALTAVALACLAGTHDTRLAVVLFLVFSAMQWMSSPGLYNLLMTKVPDGERSTASSMTMFCNAVVASGATAGAGILFARFGYPRILLGIAALAVVVAMLFWSLVGPMNRRMPVQPELS